MSSDWIDIAEVLIGLGIVVVICMWLASLRNGGQGR